MINYIDLVELQMAFYFLFLLTLAGASYYFSRKYIKQEAFFKEEVFENIKNLDKEIKEIKNLTHRNHQIQEYLIKNQENNEEICNSFKITLSKINAYNIDNNKLLNIINRKINKSIKE